MTIRPGTAADAAALADFAARTFAETFAADCAPADMEEHLARAYGIAQQTAELTDPGTATLLAEEAGTLVGYLPRAFAALERLAGLRAAGEPE